MQGAVDPRKQYRYVAFDERDLPADQQTVVWISCMTGQESDDESARIQSAVTLGRHNKIKTDTAVAAAIKQERWMKHVHQVAPWQRVDGTITTLKGDAVLEAFQYGSPKWRDEIDDAIRDLSRLQEGALTDLDSSRPSPISEAVPS